MGCFCCLCFVVDRGPSQQPTGRSQQMAEVMPTPVSAVTSSTHVSESLPSGQLQPPYIRRYMCVGTCTYVYDDTFEIKKKKG